MTGLWQVSGRSKLSYTEMIELDIEYITQWSLWLDLTILLRTPGALLRRGAAA
jgi:lipopolysaccharide/colanic/teichoic acid biosynthesis glycosyltransferase